MLIVRQTGKCQYLLKRNKITDNLIAQKKFYCCYFDVVLIFPCLCVYIVLLEAYTMLYSYFSTSYSNVVISTKFI